MKIRKIKLYEALNIWWKLKDEAEFCYDIGGCEEGEDPSTSMEEEAEFESAFQDGADIRIYMPCVSDTKDNKIDHIIMESK